MLLLLLPAPRLSRGSRQSPPPGRRRPPGAEPPPPMRSYCCWTGRPPPPCPPHCPHASARLDLALGAQGIALSHLVVDLGLPVAPAVAHLQPAEAPARCLRRGAAMAPERVRAAGPGLGLGPTLGTPAAAQAAPRCWRKMFFRRTSTAHGAALRPGIGACRAGNGSLKTPAPWLEGALWSGAWRAAGLGTRPKPAEPIPWAVVARGYPMQPLAAGVLLAAARGRACRVLLAGGKARWRRVLALALCLAQLACGQQLAGPGRLAHHAWVAGEARQRPGAVC